MRLVFVLPLVVGLAACQGTSVREQQAMAEAQPQTDPAIALFEQACLGSAPDFATAIARASAYGIGPDGTRPTQDLSIHVKPGTECLVMTPQRASNVATVQFYETVNRATGSSEDKDVPFPARYAGQGYVFFHTRNGGDAFGMVKS